MATGGSTAAVAFTVLLGGLLSVVAWVAGAWSIDALRRQRGAVAAGGVGLFIAFFSLTDSPFLMRSQVPQASSSTFGRGAVAGSPGLGVG